MDELGGGTPKTVGPFRLLRRLGAGGMAEAFEGLREGPGGFEQRVCIKRVLPLQATDPELIRLFHREARLAAVLSHRNVTRVLEFGEDRGICYLALELVDGMDLRTLLRRVGRALPVQLALLIALEIAQALEHAHTHGGRTGPVVHRDVSPANILLSFDGDVKLTDFGIAKAIQDPRVTRSSTVRGNVWYMAPELLEHGAEAEPRSDLYSLGAVLYQCLSGRRPYRGPTTVAAMMALVKGEQIPLRVAAPDLPEEIYPVVERLMAHLPARRFPSARAAVDALAAVTVGPAARRGLTGLLGQHRSPTTMPDPDMSRTTPDAPGDAPAIAATRTGVPAFTPTSLLAVEQQYAVTARPTPPPNRPAAAALAGPAERPRWQSYAVAPNVWEAKSAEGRLERTQPSVAWFALFAAIAGLVTGVAAIATWAVLAL